MNKVLYGGREHYPEAKSSRAADAPLAAERRPLFAIDQLSGSFNDSRLFFLRACMTVILEQKCDCVPCIVSDGWKSCNMLIRIRVEEGLMGLYEWLRAKGFSRRFLLAVSLGGFVIIESIAFYVCFAEGLF